MSFEMGRWFAGTHIGRSLRSRSECVEHRVILAAPVHPSIGARLSRLRGSCLHADL